MENLKDQLKPNLVVEGLKQSNAILQLLSYIGYLGES